MSSTATIEVPMRGKKWVAGGLVRDGDALYRVAAGRPMHYHEDCLPLQRVTRVRQAPADWAAAARLLAIMETLRTTGTHTPASRGAYGRPSEQVADQPAADGESVCWEARQEATSYASYPTLAVTGDLLLYREPGADEAPLVTWRQDADLAEEARALIGQRPRLTRYPRVQVRV